MKVGVLALQGGFALHQERLNELGARVLTVVSERDLEAVDGLVLPGGESSTLLKLCPVQFRDAIVRRVDAGMPVLATCAGVILIAKKVENPAQESLGVLDVDVRRNAYGRQRESSIVNNLNLTEAGERVFEDPPREGVFIRAPKIIRTGAQVESLITRQVIEESANKTEKAPQREPVLVRQKNILAATFHPELSPGLLQIHALFLRSVAGN